MGVSPAHLENDSSSISASFWLRGIRATAFLKAENIGLDYRALRKESRCEALPSLSQARPGAEYKWSCGDRVSCSGEAAPQDFSLCVGSWIACILIPVQSFTWLSPLGWLQGLGESTRLMWETQVFKSSLASQKAHLDWVI